MTSGLEAVFEGTGGLPNGSGGHVGFQRPESRGKFLNMMRIKEGLRKIR